MFRPATTALLRRPALAHRHQLPSIKAATKISARSAVSYTKILDKVLGINVHEKTKMVPTKDIDPMYQKPVILPSPEGVQICRVAFRSFQTHRLDFYMNFCRKAAYSMGIPCTGAVCLPRVTRRWTVLKSPFVHKSAMEVFERRTHKRLLVVRDADPEVVKLWLEYINKNIPVGIGMKYWINEYETLDVGSQIEKAMQTGDTRKVDAEALSSTKYVEGLVTRGRRRMWTTYKDLPVYDRANVEKLALDIASRLKTDPKANIEQVTREVVLGSRPPKEVKKTKELPAQSPTPPSSPETTA